MNAHCTANTAKALSLIIPRRRSWCATLVIAG